MTTKTKGLLTVLTAYVIALLLGFVSLKFSSHYSSILQILIADVIATFVIYSFSVYYKNSSFYDPYWSVIPPFIAFFWLAKNNYIINIPSILLMIAVLF
jgi:ABC-type branched-subunit amino acid transport system permease subunit